MQKHGALALQRMPRKVCTSTPFLSYVTQSIGQSGVVLCHCTSTAQCQACQACSQAFHRTCGYWGRCERYGRETLKVLKVMDARKNIAMLSFIVQAEASIEPYEFSTYEFVGLTFLLSFLLFYFVLHMPLHPCHPSRKRACTCQLLCAPISHLETCYFQTIKNIRPSCITKFFTRPQMIKNTSSAPLHYFNICYS